MLILAHGKFIRLKGFTGHFSLKVFFNLVFCFWGIEIVVVVVVLILRALNFWTPFILLVLFANLPILS